VSAAIAVFVKTPSLSPVKTRLAAGIGETKARAFYGLCLKAIEETLKHVDATAFWAVGEEDGLDDPLWQGSPRLYTGSGGLGQRQHHIYETLRQQHAKVLLIGADTPQLSQPILQEAITALDDYDFTIGPARDGGYYLFGGRISVAGSVWTGTTYSTATTRQELLTQLPSAPHELPLLTDVDTQDDLAQAQQEMPGGMTETQQNIMAWLQAVILSEVERSHAR